MLTNVDLEELEADNHLSLPGYLTDDINEVNTWATWASKHSGTLRKAAEEARCAHRNRIGRDLGTVGFMTGYTSSATDIKAPVMIRANHSYQNPESVVLKALFYSTPMVGCRSERKVGPGTARSHMVPGTVRLLELKKDVPGWLDKMVLKTFMTPEAPIVDLFKSRLPLLGLNKVHFYMESGHNGYGVGLGTNQYGAADASQKLIPKHLIGWVVTEFRKRLRPIAEEMILRKLYCLEHEDP